jgi:hypothetical protein
VRVEEASSSSAPAGQPPEELAQAIAGSVQSLAEAFGAPLRELVEAFAAPWRAIGEALTQPWQQVTQAYSEQWQSIASALTKQWQEAAASQGPSLDIARLQQEITSTFFSTVVEAYASQQRQLAQTIRDSLDPLARQAADAAEKLKEDLRSQLGQAGATVRVSREDDEGGGSTHES